MQKRHCGGARASAAAHGGGRGSARARGSRTARRSSRSYGCVAQLGGKLLRGGGKGSYTFKLPKNAKGKRLRVSLFVTYGGITDEFDPYVFEVR